MTSDVDIRPFTILSLFTGAGGLDLGLRLAVPNARTVCYVEREAYCCAILAQRMEDGQLEEAPIWTDIRTFRGEPWSGLVDCIVGGYPCQPFSKLGKRLSSRDERHLWPHVARTIAAVRPGWCFFENVTNHLRLDLEQVLDDLRSMDYTAAAGVFSAEEVVASQSRDRLFIVSHANHLRGRHSPEQMHGQGRGAASVRSSLVSPDQTRGTHRADPDHRPPGPPLAFPPAPDDWGRWSSSGLLEADLEPTICRMGNGMAHWVDRIRAIGNGVVPAVAALAWRELTNALRAAP